MRNLLFKMAEKHDVDREMIRKGIDELLKLRVNEIFSHGGPFTLASALQNYYDTKQLAIRFGVVTLAYDAQIENLRKSLDGAE